MSGALANGYQGYVSSLDRALVERIQQALRSQGFDPGKIDGAYGPRTKSAIIAFRAANKIEEGELDEILTPRLSERLLGVPLTAGRNGLDLDDLEQVAVMQALEITPREPFAEQDISNQYEILQALGLVPGEDLWEKYVFPDTEPVPIEGEVTRPGLIGSVADRPGFCYFRDTYGQTIVAGCSDVAGPLNPGLAPVEILGGWSVTAGQDSCQLYLTLTAWKSGGYHASTRNCSSPALQSVAAWDLRSQEVVLMSGSGGEVGKLTLVKDVRLEGTTIDGISVNIRRP